VPVMVVPTELAVPVAVGMLLQVLEVQPLQSHPGPLELPVDPGHVGPGPGHADQVAHTPEEPGFELGVVPLGRQGPGQAGLPCSVAVRSHGAQPTPQARAIARWGRRCSYFRRRISRTCLISSLSVMSVGALLHEEPPYRAGRATDERSRSESAIRSPAWVITMRRNR
jgi:hypothetical protein